MPVAVPTPELGSFQHVPETKENLDWADLVTLDLSLYATPSGKAQLAQQLISALRTKGFFYLKNFNISQERVDRQFGLAKKLHDLEEEEKLKYISKHLVSDDGSKFHGYIPAGRRVVNPATGLKDNVSMYNIPKFAPGIAHEHPPALVEHQTEIEEFSKVLYTDVLNPLYVLLAIALELPEDTFININKADAKTDDHLRYMKYSKRKPEELKEVEHFVVGHSDLGSFTLLFRQPVAGLQIRDPTTDQWKWVKPIDNTLTVNACDALQFLTGGYVKSTIHRVTTPPKDQQHVDRLGVLYFARPHGDTPLATLAQSKVLQREGFTQNEIERSGNPVPTVDEFSLAKQKWYRTSGPLVKEHVNDTIVPGFREQEYA